MKPAVETLRLLVAWLCLLVVSEPSLAKTISPPISLAWTNNLLTIAGGDIPGGRIEVWYLEAFCRTGAHDRDWRQTTVPHQTKLVSVDKSHQRLKLRTSVEPNVEVLHDIRVRKDAVEFRLTVKNQGSEFADVQWFQPCIRVDRFTGRGQSNYHERCFLFTGSGLAPLDKTRRTEEALYRGGQVYVPPGIDPKDVNPRPISPDKPVNALIGCFSGDDRFILATAWDQTHELFQGVIVCIHNDPHIGGLKPGETKHLRGVIYLFRNDPAALLKRYRRDFPP